MKTARRRPSRPRGYIPLDRRGTVREAFAIRDGRICALGSTAEINAFLAGPLPRGTAL